VCYVFPVDAVAQALADPIRREILVMLREGPRNAGAVADAFHVSRPAISRHLRVLREAGLVRDTVTGRERAYALDLAALAPLEAFLARLRGPRASQAWSQRLDALETEVHRVRRSRQKSKAEADERSKTTSRTAKERKAV
jgi:DNA-binding transcriptional ArsR family regulator